MDATQQGKALPQSILERLPISLGEGAPIGVRFLTAKLPLDYDVVSVFGSPSELIRNRNPRVCWTLMAPLRGAYDLYSWYMKHPQYLEKNAPLDLVRHRLNINSYRAIDRMVVQKIERICPISQEVNLRLKRYLGRDGGEVVNPGINPEEFHCKEYGRFFFYPSRLSVLKRHDIAIEAFRKFSMKRKGWKLVIAGFVNDYDRDYLAELKTLAARCEGVELLIDPPRDTLIELYSICYATLFSAINEDWGYVILEAMASSKPVISIDEGGPREIIYDGQTGYLVKDADGMAQKMEAVAGDPGLTERLGKAGRSRVEKNHTVEIYLDKMEKIFKEVSAGKRG